MSLISAERFNELKAKVKAECLRRDRIGSVAAYADSSYDFTVVPTSGSKILQEHYIKNATPLNAISGDIPTDGNRVIKESDIAALEEKVKLLASKGLRSSDTGCSASCTGLCSSACSGGCSGGCKGDCEGSCSGDCDGSCKGGCEGSCGDQCSSCSDECSTNCSWVVVAGARSTN